jgi:hypothetical protein
MSKIKKIKHNTKRTKYIKKKKNHKTIKRKKHFFKKIRGGAPMTDAQRYNAGKTYEANLKKLLDNVKIILTSVTTDKEFYNVIENKNDDINKIVDNDICKLLINMFI